MLRWMTAAPVLLLTSALAFAGEPVQDVQADAPRGEHAEAAHGAEAKGGEHEKEEKKGIAETIFEHVSDSDELEFPIPAPFDGVTPVYHLPTLRFETHPGACVGHPDRTLGTWTAGCIDLSITKHVLMMWIAGLLLVLAFLFGGHRNKAKLVPHGTAANLLEMMVLFVRDEIAIKNIGKEEGPRYTPYLLTIFFFILFMNLFGLIPFMATATGNLGVTLGLALCTFFVTQYAGIRSAGLGGYLKHLTGGVHWLLWPIMVPVEILGLFTKPFALTVRLFANMLAGHIVIYFLLGLIFIIGSVAVAGVAVPFAMAIYFLELFVALVQAYIFAMLSSLFIGMSVAMGHHDHDHPHEAEGAHSHDHGKAHQLG